MRISIGNFTIIIRDNPRFSISFKTKNGWYSEDYKAFKKAMGENNDFPLYKNYPCLNDRDDACGAVRTPYFTQDLYVATKIFNSNPERHVDIGSSITGFVSHVAVFREIEVFDIRCMPVVAHNIIFKQADFTDPMSAPSNYCDSISCLHALEHFGLGRYGDKIDPDGHLKGFEQITRILKPGGTFYFSVPMGIQRIEFNAHRIFCMKYLLNWVSQSYNIVSFAYIDDSCILHDDVVLNDTNINTSFGCNHGCAIFELKKKQHD